VYSSSVATERIQPNNEPRTTNHEPNLKLNTNREVRTEKRERQHSGLVRTLDLVMTLLFAFAAALQFNDPDPVRWIAIYGAASVLSLTVFFRRRVPPAVAIGVAAIALVWAASIAFGGPAASEYSHMFDAWEMKSPSVEEAREASGLLIVAAWMTVIGVRPLHV
jgi:Transmembrane family 220, helix